MRLLARLVLVLLLALGLVLPKVSAALAVATGAGTVVLCDGQGLITLSLPDDEGSPTALAHADCALLHALAGSVATQPHLWQPAVLAATFPRAIMQRTVASRALLPEARAPPAA